MDIIVSVSSIYMSTPSRPSRRTAFLVGINYINTQSELNGCYNDVVNVSQYLRSTLGYTAGSITVLTDGNRGALGTASSLPPTRQNIIAGLTDLVAGMIPGDEAVFHFSGHGSLVRDTNGDEVTGLDSCLCPLDYAVHASAGGGMITDDEIRTLLVNKVPHGARLYVILDCCHNGTGCDIRYKYEDFSVLLRQRPTPIWRTMQRAYFQGKYNVTAGEVYMISGCRDEQTSADAYINNAFAGALTYAVFSILRANQATIRTYSWSSLLRDVRHFMRVNRYSQIPQLMTGQFISPERPVFALVTGRGASLDLNTGSGSTGGYVSPGSRGMSTSNTMFSFVPKTTTNNKRFSIQFIH
jgi:hypothetical protein